MAFWLFGSLHQDGGLMVVPRTAYMLAYRDSFELRPPAHHVFRAQAEAMAFAVLRASSCSMNGTWP